MKFFTLFLFVFIFWMLLTFNLELPNIVIGLSASFLTALVFVKSFVGESYKFFQPHRWFWLIIYLFIFIWECIKANFDVAYRVLHPKLPIKPGIVKVKCGLKTDIAKTFLANSITMTPGTITLDIEKNDFYIHWIYVKDIDPKQYSNEISGRFEKYIKRIFE